MEKGEIKVKIVYKVCEVRFNGGEMADELRTMADQYVISDSEFASEEDAIIGLADMTRGWSPDYEKPVYFEIRKFYKF